MEGASHASLQDPSGSTLAAFLLLALVASSSVVDFKVLSVLVDLGILLCVASCSRVLTVASEEEQLEQQVVMQLVASSLLLLLVVVGPLTKNASVSVSPQRL